MNNHHSLDNFDPEAFGFRGGLEVHHQILTEQKLFCRCPAGLYSEEYDAQVLRHMRPTLSELGEYDGTALMEFKTKKEIIYRLNKQSVCTYEMDDNPPFLINRQAVDISIEIALMLNCSIVGELHVSRKQYLDGSIPAGFQRTVIVGVNGWIPYNGRKIGIIQLALEEDACREVSDVGHRRVYLTDRLSIPLIEVVTAPDMKNPLEMYEVGVIIGNLLRMTGKVRRGIGSVRQDVNVSIKGGKRVEIKGVPRLPLIPDLVHWEAYRQHKLLTLKDKMHARGINQDNFTVERYDITGKFEFEHIEVEGVGDIKVGAIKLCGIKGLLGEKIGSTRTFAHDIAGRVRVIACMNNHPTLLHTEATQDFVLSEQDISNLHSLTSATQNDTIVAVWGDQRDVETALNEIEIRCRETAVGLPDETRQALQNGETDFERILPGPDRMYPDTDSPPLAISSEEVSRIKAGCKERPWERTERLSRLGLSKHLIDVMLISPRINMFYYLVDDKGVDPAHAAVTLGELLVYIKRMGADLNELEDQSLENLFDLQIAGKITREAFRLLLEDYVRTGSDNWKVLIDLREMYRTDNIKVKEIVKGIVADKIEECYGAGDVRLRFMMGEVMEKLRGAILGKELKQLVSEELKPN